MLEAMISGLQQTIGWSALGLMLLAVLLGNFFGAVPGLGGNLGIALLIPFVFGMNPMMGFVLLLGMHSVVHTGGSVPSIMFGIPGTGPDAATILDGYPLAQKGEAGRAIGANMAASGIGGCIGAGVLAGLIPALRPVALALSSAEIFMLIVFGLTFVAIVSRGAVLKGLIAACFGLALAAVGLCPHTGIGRFTFGQLWLWDGVNIITIVVGVFAIAEMIDMGARGTRIASDEAIDLKEAGSWGLVLEGIKDVFRNWWLTLRSSVIGCFIGIIPGLGGSAASWICYGHAAQTCKNNENFGKGDIRGVIAPEAANNSKEGGSLLPTVVFGIPGSSGMAILLGAFMILGIAPGREMLTKHLDLIWGMVWIMIIANIMGAAMMLGLAQYIARVTFLPPSLLVPLVLILAMTGAFLATSHWENLILAVFFGILGYWMKKHDYGRAPLILGFVLGGLAEMNLHKSLGVWGPAFLLRPGTLVLLSMVVLSALYPVFEWYRNKRKQKAGEA